jgi:hypothetical protein
MSRMRISIDCLYAFYHSLIPGDAFNHGDTHVSSRFSSAFFFCNENHHEKKRPIHHFYFDCTQNP